MQNRVKLSSIIRDVINETIKQDMWMVGHKERELQHSSGITEADDDEEKDELFSDDEEGDDEKSTPSKTIDDEKEKLSKGDVTADDVVERLNSIRAGRSFKDEKIAAQLEEYVESLTRAERTALLAYLKGISQIVSGEFQGEEALDPGDDPVNISMAKKDAVQKKTIKATVVKRPEKDEDEKKKKKPAEDTSGPVPIRPKK